MFSRAEREFLVAVATGRGGGRGETVERAFPNPVYRRKLMWSIRRKAERSLRDWALYAEAARREARLVVPDRTGPGPEPPVFVDPVARLYLGVRRRLLRGRS